MSEHKNTAVQLPDLYFLWADLYFSPNGAEMRITHIDDIRLYFFGAPIWGCSVPTMPAVNIVSEAVK